VSARDGHIGELAAALVDGALDGNTRDQALAHITGCTDCRSEVDQQRYLKDRLRRLSYPSPPPGLTDRLRAIGDPSDIDASRTLVPAAGPPPAAVPAPTSMPKPHPPVPVAGRRPGGTSRPSAAPARSHRRSRRLRRVTGGVGVVALGVAAALTLGPLRAQGPAVSPPVGAYEVEHARTTGGVPGTDPGAGAAVTVSVNR